MVDSFKRLNQKGHPLRMSFFTHSASQSPQLQRIPRNVQKQHPPLYLPIVFSPTFEYNKQKLTYPQVISPLCISKYCT